jgi:Phage integrase family
MLRTDPAGDPLGPDAFVFGDEVGGGINSVKTAWRTACGKAGIEDLRFHDLRREFACRLLESRAELHDVRDFLGHATIQKRQAACAATIPVLVPHGCHTAVQSGLTTRGRIAAKSLMRLKMIW